MTLRHSTWSPTTIRPLALLLTLVLSGPAASLLAQDPVERRLPFSRIVEGELAVDAFSSPSASWIDIDGDGDEDLYVLNGYGSLEEEPAPQPDILYRNDGAGRFTPVPGHPLAAGDPTFSGSGVWGDYDNDGDPDLFVANQSGADNRLFRNDGAGGFVAVAEGAAVSDGGRSFSAAWVDIDGDGRLDLHVLNGRDGDGGEVDFVYRNGGDGTLERVENLRFLADTLPSGGAAWADYDADGDVDLFLPVNGASDADRLYRNEGGWTFTPVTAEAGLSPDPLPSWPRSSVAEWVDYDGDGDLDMFVGNSGALDFLFANDGAGRFERVTAGRVGLEATYVSDALWADLDNDGDLDLVRAVWGGASEIYRNDGAGDLHPVGSGEFGERVHFASSVSASDIDTDGDLDLFLTQWPINEAGGAPNPLYRNDGEAAGWIRVELEGTASNRSGIGAVILVDARIGGEARAQLRHVASRTSWRSAGGLARHFGLGDARQVDRIEVRWPSGRTDVVDGPVETNRTVTIVEGSGRRE